MLARSRNRKRVKREAWEGVGGKQEERFTSRGAAAGVNLPLYTQRWPVETDRPVPLNGRARASVYCARTLACKQARIQTYLHTHPQNATDTQRALPKGARLDVGHGHIGTVCRRQAWSGTKDKRGRPSNVSSPRSGATSSSCHLPVCRSVRHTRLSLGMR